jgi:ubiquinone/menaquinone biosynthesis C-methylase UbiE
MESNKRKTILEFIPGPHRQKTCLELGCGENAVTFNSVFKSYEGVDFILPQNPPKKFSKLDLDKVEKLPYKDNEFDVALVLDVLEHLRYPDRISAELCRVVKPEGRIIVTLPNEFAYPALLYHLRGQNWISGDPLTGHKWFFSIPDADKFVANNYEIVDKRYISLSLRTAGGFGTRFFDWLAGVSPRWFARDLVYGCKPDKANKGGKMWTADRITTGSLL